MGEMCAALAHCLLLFEHRFGDLDAVHLDPDERQGPNFPYRDTMLFLRIGELAGETINYGTGNFRLAAESLRLAGFVVVDRCNRAGVSGKRGDQSPSAAALS